MTDAQETKKWMVIKITDKVKSRKKKKRKKNSQIFYWFNSKSKSQKFMHTSNPERLEITKYIFFSPDILFETNERHS